MLAIKYKRFIEIRKIYRDLIHFIFKCSVANDLINQMFHLFLINYEPEIAGIRLIVFIYHL